MTTNRNLNIPARRAITRRLRALCLALGALLLIGGALAGCAPAAPTLQPTVDVPAAPTAAQPQTPAEDGYPPPATGGDYPAPGKVGARPTSSEIRAQLVSVETSAQDAAVAVLRVKVIEARSLEGGADNLAGKEIDLYAQSALLPAGLQPGAEFSAEVTYTGDKESGVFSITRFVAP